MDYQYYNALVLERLAKFLNETPDAFTAKDIEAFCDIGIDKAMAYAYLLGEALGFDTGGADRLVFEKYFACMVTECDVKSYLSDEYFKRVKFTEKEVGAWRLTVETLKPFEAFVVNDMETYPNGKCLPRIAFFPEEYKYYAVLNNGREWMTVLPNEINTIRPIAEKVYGRVVTYGLGLGYFALHAALNKNVESVTVVEIDKDVIKLFTTEILPYFAEVAKKIRIVNDDAFKFASALKNGEYNCVFADIWHDVGDGVPTYLNLKEFENACPDTKFYYWIEKSLKVAISAEKDN